MSSYAAVRGVVYDVCNAILPAELPGIKIYPTAVKSPALPAIIIRPGRPTGRPYVALGSRSAKWKIDVLLLLGTVNENVSQERAYELLSPSSALVQALKSVRVGTGFLATSEIQFGEQSYNKGWYEGGRVTLTGSV